MKSASSGDSNPADSSNGSSPKVPPLRIVFSTNSGSGTIGANAANVDHTYSSSGDSATAAGTPDDGTITKTRKRQKTGTNNSNDVSSSCTSSGGGSLRATAASASNSSSPVTTGKRHHHHHHHHHKTNNCSSSVASSKRKHSSSSSDSEEDTSVENCDEKNEAASSGAGNSSPGCPSTVNANTPSSSTNVVGTKPTSPGSSNQSEPKVPSLRIVISSSGTSGASNSNSVTQSSSNATNDSQKVSSSNASSSLSSSSNGKNLPYVVSSSTAASSDGNDDVGTTECDNSANTSTSVTTSTTISSSGRVTRSSQRAAQQQQQKQDGDTDRTTVSPTSTSNASTKDSSKDGNSESQSKEKSDGREQHSRRRKLRNKQQNQPARPQQSTEHEDDNESTSSSTSSGVGANSTNGSNEKEPKISKEFQMPSYNCYHMYLNIRKQIDKRRKQMFPVQPKAPQGFKDYLLNKGSYLVEGKIRLPLYGQSTGSGHKNYASLLSSSPPPVSLKPGSALYNLHIEQERARQKLRLQHLIEKEKLQLSTEQEVLRVHGRAALAMANQSVPFSVCTILKDEEIYNTIEAEPDSTSAENGSNSNGNNVASSRNEYQRATYSSSNNTSGVGTDLVTLTGNSGGSSTRSRYNGRLFLSWLQDVDDKWEKIKEETLLRHKREAESLHAIQRLEWEWKMKELGVCDVKSAPVIDEQLVPSVTVSDDFDLLPV